MRLVSWFCTVAAMAGRAVFSLLLAALVGSAVCADVVPLVLWHGMGKEEQREREREPS